MILSDWMFSIKMKMPDGSMHSSTPRSLTRIKIRDKVTAKESSLLHKNK